MFSYFNHLTSIQEVAPWSNVPEELKSYKQWVAWKAVFRDNNKITKLPVNPIFGWNASTSNPTTWGTYDEAVTYYKNHKAEGIDGIGFVFTKDDPFCGIDLDDCYDPETDKMEDWASEVLKDLNSYCEISPSNTGVKIFTKGSLPGSGKNSGNIEMYDTGRYFTVTGARLEEFPSTIENSNGEVVRLYNKIGGIKKKDKPVPIKKPVQTCNIDINIDSLPVSVGTKKLIREGENYPNRSEAIMSVVNALVGNGISEPEIFKIFDTCPIGEKYHEKGSSKRQWLLGRIEKAKGYVTVKEDSEEPEPETTLAFPSEVMTGAAGSFADV